MQPVLVGNMADLEKAFVLVCFISYMSTIWCFEDDEFLGDTASTLMVEHSFDQGPDPKFTKRGVININSITSGIAQYRSDGTSLTQDDLQALKKAAEIDGIYRVKIRSKREEVHSVSTFVKACSLIESSLRDVITVNVDSSGHVLGVSLQVSHAHCGEDVPSVRNLQSFSTVVEVVQSSLGPSPDTQSYLAKVEQERAKKVEGAQGDNRSFLAKYWMYIVPVMVFMLIANSADSNAQGGGR